MKSVAMMALLCLLAAVPSNAAGLTPFAKRILAAHNAERTLLKLPRLAWSDVLAADAAVWANEMAKTGKFQHSPRAVRKGQGENLWIGSAGAYMPEEMVEAWADEQQHFHNGVFPDVATPGEGHVVGHYITRRSSGRTRPRSAARSPTETAETSSCAATARQGT